MDSATPQQQRAYVNKVKQEVEVQQMQELMGKITETCISKCTGTSGNSLDSREQSCLSNCSDRYMETMQLVNQVLVERNN
mmetsp:Transcript_28587/g.48301  ORF Transcript_28587/g.48301 Transcript_28587/m.48301 type:complete len:80 (+) Transcript_28587:53-292(+)